MLFFYMFLFLYSVYSLELKPVKLCANCKHYMLRPYVFNSENEKCSLFPVIKVNRNRFGPGYTSYIDYEKCVVVRNDDNMCGKEGRRYELRNDTHHDSDDERVIFSKKLAKDFTRKRDTLIKWTF